jgi:hypothetical protein
MAVPLWMKRYLPATILLACMAAEPALAMRWRGAKRYPYKETTAEMSGVNRIFVGWVDLKEDDWAMHGYSTKAEWVSEIPGLNAALTGFCGSKYLIGKTVAGAKEKGDENAAGYDLYIKFSDVLIDYNKYQLYFRYTSSTRRRIARSDLFQPDPTLGTTGAL